MSDSLRNRDGLTEAEFLASYDANRFPRPSVTVDMVLFTVTSKEEENYRKLPDKQLRVLMIKRGNHPFIYQWALPGGFVGVDEGLDEAAARELKEETNIDNIYMEQLYTYGEPHRDPRTRVISCAYMSLIDAKSINVQAGDDADDAQWFTVSERLMSEHKTMLADGYEQIRTYRLTLNAENEADIWSEIQVKKTVQGRVTRVERSVIQSHGVAFDHAKVIHYGLERLRNKIEYTDIAFNLMPELFTLSELQQVYEVILGRELLMVPFRRLVAPMVTETNEYQKGRGHKPAKFYRFNPNWVESKLP